MKVGVTLPQFRDEADSALAGARRAEAARAGRCLLLRPPLADGPARPPGALGRAAARGALAASTTTIAVGSLVARIGLLDDEVLVSVLTSLSLVSGGRFIAGLGTGDHQSQAENQAFGVAFEQADERRARMAAVARAAAPRRDPGMDRGRSGQDDRGGPPGRGWPSTCGGPSPAGWPSSPGPAWKSPGAVPSDATEGEVARRLRQLADAGAAWAVCAWPSSLEMVAEAAAMVRHPS